MPKTGVDVPRTGVDTKKVSGARLHLDWRHCRSFMITLTIRYFVRVVEHLKFLKIVVENLRFLKIGVEISTFQKKGLKFKNSHYP